MDVDFEVTGVSRSGRVRKKSSKLMDFESPDDIESRQRKLPPPRTVVAPNTSRNFSHESEPTYADSKSENEEIADASSDSDYYDPTFDNQSVDSMDSEEANMSDSDSSDRQGDAVRNLLRSSNYDKSRKRKSSIKDEKNISYTQANFSPNSSQQHLNSRNRSFLYVKNIQNSSGNSNSTVNNSPNSSGMYRVVGIGPIEIGAHLHLLGESLTIIGERLKEHEGQIAISGSVSVLLDTLLCSLAPLICLTAHIPSIAPPTSLLQDTLDNIAYIMPGL